MKTCVVIPAYNEGRYVGSVVAGCLKHTARVIVVDDCSTDDTASEAEKAGAEVIRHEENLGKGGAIRTGLDRARDEGFDAAVFLDADQQHDPGRIPDFIAAAGSPESGEADIVVGCRMDNVTGMPLLRRWTNRFTSWVLSSLAGVKLRDTQSGYRLIRLRAWQELDLRTSRFDTEGEMLVQAARKGFRIAEIPIATIYGDEKSKIRPVRDTFRFFRLVWRLFWSRRKDAGS